MPSPTDGDYHAHYAAAHHDTWWAKSQLWAATGWGFALLGGIAGLAKLLDIPTGDSPPARALVALQIVVGLGISAYLARLHYDMVSARKKTEKLKELRPELDQIAGAMPGHAHSAPNDVRGAIFPLLLVAALAFAQGISTFVVLRSGGWSSGLAIVTLLIGLALIGIARRAAG